MTRPHHRFSIQKRIRHKLSQPSRLWLVLLTGIGILAVAIRVLIAVMLSSKPLLQDSYADQSFRRDRPVVTNKGLQFASLSQPVNVLLLGTKVLTVDVNHPDRHNLGYHALVDSLEGRTDVILLLRFEPEQKQVTVMSIPRDTRVRIEGYGVNKINTANVLGGPVLSAQAVSEVLDGIQIDRYVRVNVQGVEKLIDALGGVTVNVPKDMRYQDDTQHLYINLKAGRQHFSGNDALSFLRFRQDRWGDIGRIQRQQQFMRALTEQALTPATLLRIPEILSVIQSHVDTNLSSEELLALAKFARDIKPENLQLLMLPGQFSSKSSHSYWLPDPNRISALVAKYFDLDLATYETALGESSTLRVAIQDGSDDPAAINTVINQLAQAGYSRTYIATVPWSEPLATTRIIAQQGDRRSAESIRQSLGFGSVYVENTGSLQSDVTVQLGQDWRQHLVADVDELEIEDEV